MTWVPCRCGEFYCTIHRRHVSECSCPPIEDWTTDPYMTKTSPRETARQIAENAGCGKWLVEAIATAIEQYSAAITADLAQVRQERDIAKACRYVLDAQALGLFNRAQEMQHRAEAAEQALDEARREAAVALGSIKSPKKAATSAANGRRSAEEGKKGGRPRKTPKPPVATPAGPREA